MKKLLLMVVACGGLLLTSCNISREATTNQNSTQTQVVLSKKNYKVVGYVEGESTQNYWFGIGGMSKKSLSESAVSEMYKNANLTGSQAVINVSVAYKSKMILIYNQVKAISTGTIVEFTQE